MNMRGEVFVKSAIIDSIRPAAEIAAGKRVATAPAFPDIGKVFCVRSLSNFSLRRGTMRRPNFRNNQIQRYMNHRFKKKKKKSPFDSTPRSSIYTR